MSSPTDMLRVHETLRHVRLDRFVADQLEDVSRSAIQRLIIECHVKVNGQPTKPTYSPRAGDVITIHWPAPKVTGIVPQDIPLAILHEDSELLILNKAPDLVVHPSAGHEDGTIVNAVLHHCQGKLSGVGGVVRPGIVHRLDLGTSGCMVIAKNDRAHLKLNRLFSRREVEKIYQCIVCGSLKPEAGDVKAAIARHPTHRKRMAVSDGTKGRFAWTTYRLLERLRNSSFVEATLHTGRTHQIRVHLQHLGFPIVGDLVYGKRQNSRLKEETGYEAPRQMLHARKLAFRHPASGRFMEFNAPLPDDFQAALHHLRGDTT